MSSNRRGTGLARWLTVWLLAAAACACADESVVPKRLLPDAELPAREVKANLGAVRYSPKEERESAREVLAFYSKPGMLMLDPDQQARIERIAHKLVTAAYQLGPRQIPLDGDAAPAGFTFRVLNNNDKNAFSAWNGNIYISRGMLDFLQSDDELAGVLGHEISHSMFHHLHNQTIRARRYQWQEVLAMIAATFMKINVAEAVPVVQYLYIGLMNGHSVEDETQADLAGCYYAYRAGYNPVGMITAFERMHRWQASLPTPEELGVFKTHPWSNDRAHSLERQVSVQLGLPIVRRDVVDSVTAQVHAHQLPNGGRRVVLAVGGSPLFEVAPAPGLAAEVWAGWQALRLNQALVFGAKSANLHLVPVGENYAIRGLVRLRSLDLLTLSPADAKLAGQPPERFATAVLAKLRARIEVDEIATGPV